MIQSNERQSVEASVSDYSDYLCVVGAGPAGLSLARALKARGIPFHVFERHGDVGGIWDIEVPGSPMYESAHFISSKYQSSYADFPMPDHYPDYPSHRQILAYHRAFAREYDLYRHIEFNAPIRKIIQRDSRWLVELERGEQRLYGAVVCATGTTWSPNVPELPGRATFRGKVIHSIEYRDPSLFRAKRVLIVGAGNSGCDIACDAAVNATQAFLSVRRGYYFIPKHVFGAPADVFASGAHWIPGSVGRWLLEKILNLLVGDLTKLGLPKPDHRIFETHPIVNDQVLHCLRHGDLQARGDVARLDGDYVEFKDGSRETIDLVVLATGFKWDIPYMPEDCFEWKNGRPDLYLALFNRRRENLYAMGYMETDGGAYKLFDEMANLLTAYIEAKRADDPSARRFAGLIEKDRPVLNDGIRYLDTSRNAVYVNQSAYKKYREKVQRRMGWPELKPGQFAHLASGAGEVSRTSEAADRAPASVAILGD
jgi:hypothetical protein